MIITLISDTHSKHNEITADLPGGEILIHAGDISTRGYQHEIESFCKWYDSLDNYFHKIFIAGNHDWGFQDYPKAQQTLLDKHVNIDYLQDEEITLYYDGPNGEYWEDNIHIYGAPWQPEFYNWAFNLPRNGVELQAKWDMIPWNLDILVTHGPAYGFVDTVYNRQHEPLGCGLLAAKIKEVKPKIHVCGHIHSGHGYKFDGDTHYFNASVLNENYEYANKPITFDWNKHTNEIKFL